MVMLECDIVRLHAYDYKMTCLRFWNKRVCDKIGVLFVPDPVQMQNRFICEDKLSLDKGRMCSSFPRVLCTACPPVAATPLHVGRPCVPGKLVAIPLLGLWTIFQLTSKIMEIMQFKFNMDGRFEVKFSELFLRRHTN